MSTEQNKALVRRVFEEIFNGNSISTVDELVATDYVYRRPGGREVRGPEMYKALIGVFRKAFPDFHFIVNQMLAEGDCVFTHWTLTGTHAGDYMGVAPSGSRIIADGMLVSRCADGKIIEELELMDELSILRQMGTSRIPEQVPAAPVSLPR